VFAVQLGLGAAASEQVENDLGFELGGEVTPFGSGHGWVFLKEPVLSYWSYLRGALLGVPGRPTFHLRKAESRR
jgi:hypothetical protein